MTVGVSNDSDLPSLADITNWDVPHLESAATDWSSKAEQWESHFTRIHHGSLSPGGTAWEGIAADTAQDRTFADLVKVRGLAENLRSAARIARSGADVVMRRGYYDATMQKGFGWDKAFWRHGVINKNVFVDLISHSRPVSNDNGTLVYEVPINRAHYTTGMFGTSCEDTGESLTMKIVVNTNASPDVPGGGQKGLITMYPLAGGSGVVEMGPNWTWTPPWVNNNVPIN